MGIFTNDKGDFDWKTTLATVAPALAGAIGGPLAGTGVKMLSEALMGHPDATEDEIKKLVMGGMTPEQLAACKKADNDFTIAMEELGIKREQLYLADTADARNRETQSGDHWTPRILAFVVLSGFYYALHWVLTGETQLADPNKAMLIGSVIGYASAKADQVISYFFGSSAGSKQKTDAMAIAATNALKK